MDGRPPQRDSDNDREVVDGEVKLDETGRPIFADLMRRRGPFVFVAFDVLAVNRKDVRSVKLTQRKKLLRAIIPARANSVLYAQHMTGSGYELFSAICAQDLEGIVAKREDSRYGDHLAGSRLRIATTPRHETVTNCSSGDAR